MVPSSSASVVIERLGDRYSIFQPIGHPFGTQQLLARDTYRQQPVVIKSLSIEDNTPAGDICCFEREIHLLETLDHPTIPPYIDSFTIDTSHEARSSKGLVLVQGHNGGSTLSQLLASGKVFCESEIKEIAKQLLQSLIYIHRKGLVHRDIKPENIVAKERDDELESVAWLNLSTVQYVQAQPKDTLVGTYGYMAPEQIGGQATFASDLYSLGATLIYLVTGHHLGELPHRHSHGRKVQFVCPTTRLSRNLQQWLNWLIEPIATDRPASAKQALAALNHLPLAMLKQRVWKPAKVAQLLPVPISAGPHSQEKPYFTRIKRFQKRRSLSLVVPPVGIHSAAYRRALPPMMMGVVMTSVTLYLFSLLSFSSDMLTTLDGVATIAAASLGVMGGIYSFRFVRTGLILMSRVFLRQIHIQLEADVLLIAHKYPLRSPAYVVNTRRQDIYNISGLTDCEALRILTHHNRTRVPRDCHTLSIHDGGLSRRDIRWLISLLNDWRGHLEQYS